MLPDIVSLSLFARVAETHSITKAAEASHIAVAAASRRLSLLEHQFGVQLLVRTARGAELTPAGQAVLYHVRQILSQVNQMHAEVAEYAKGGKGHVRIQASASAISQYLPEDLASFSAAIPEAVIAMEERVSGEIVQALREGATDIGVVMEGVNMDGLDRFDYNVDQLVALVPKKHPVRGKRVSFSTLLDFDFVGLDNATAISRLLSDQAAVLHKPLRVRMETGSFATLCKMVESGLGIGVIPEGIARSFVAGMQLRLIRLNEAWVTRRMYICVRSHQALTPIARKLVNHLIGRERLSRR